MQSSVAALARSYRKTKRFDKALEVLKAGVGEYPRSLPILLELAEWSWDQKSYNDVKELVDYMA